MSDAILLPRDVEVQGRAWQLYAAEYTTPEGKFGFYFYAISMDHAAIVLGELKSSATLTGRYEGSVRA